MHKDINGTFYYAVFSEDSLILEYEVHTIQSEARNDSIFRVRQIAKFNSNFRELEKETIKSVIVSGDIFYINKNNKLDFRMISFKKSDACTDFFAKDPLSDVLSHETCFKEVRDIYVSGVLYKQVYVFEKLTGYQSNHKVKSRIYYTNSFVLLLDEYISGYAPYYRRQLLEEKPIGFH